jgi:hypothetical protein
MALKTQTQVKQEKVRKKRPGVHSKKRTSKLKTSKLYKKSYKGQGK